MKMIYSPANILENQWLKDELSFQHGPVFGGTCEFSRGGKVNPKKKHHLTEDFSPRSQSPQKIAYKFTRHEDHEDFTSFLFSIWWLSFNPFSKNMSNLLVKLGIMVKIKQVSGKSEPKNMNSQMVVD